MIEIRNLTKTYGAVTAVDDLTVTIRPGKVTGFLGPNGAGKSPRCARSSASTGRTPATF
jgi:ABC-2 type transport system ATP-binding protein